LNADQSFLAPVKMNAFLEFCTSRASSEEQHAAATHLEGVDAASEDRKATGRKI
jgi:hypothetical protein